MSGEIFQPSKVEGAATFLICPRTGHQFVVLAPSVAALQDILEVRCLPEPTAFNPELFQCVGIAATAPELQGDGK